MNEIITKTAKIELLAKNIISIKFHLNATIGKNECIENDEAGKLLMQPNVDYVALVNAKSFIDFTQEAKEYEVENAKEKYKQIKAVAIVIELLHLRLLAKFLQNFHTRVNLVTTQIFATEKEAIQWLNQVPAEICCENN